MFDKQAMLQAGIGLSFLMALLTDRMSNWIELRLALHHDG